LSCVGSKTCAQMRNVRMAGHQAWRTSTPVCTKSQARTGSHVRALQLNGYVYETVGYATQDAS
jgi:hypothetical protein